MMTLLRDLADNSRAVAVVTHATKSLGLCDKLVVMGRGGMLCFHGSPDEALEFFGAETYDDIYAALDEPRRAEEWQQRSIAAGPGQRRVRAPSATVRNASAGRRMRRGGRVWHQARVLTARYVQAVRARPAQPAHPAAARSRSSALAIVGLFKSGVFNGRRRMPGEAVKLLFLRRDDRSGSGRSTRRARSSRRRASSCASTPSA